MSKAYVDSALWLPHDADEELIAALMQFEHSSGKARDKKLIELLRRRGHTPAYAAHRDVYLYLADLLDRYELKHRPGRPPLPFMIFPISINV